MERDQDPSAEGAASFHALDDRLDPLAPGRRRQNPHAQTPSTTNRPKRREETMKMFAQQKDTADPGYWTEIYRHEGCRLQTQRRVLKPRKRLIFQEPITGQALRKSFRSMPTD